MCDPSFRDLSFDCQKQQFKQFVLLTITLEVSHLFSYSTRGSLCVDGIPVWQTWWEHSTLVQSERSTLGSSYPSRTPWRRILQCWNEGIDDICFTLIVFTAQDLVESKRHLYKASSLFICPSKQSFRRYLGMILRPSCCPKAQHLFNWLTDTDETLHSCSIRPTVVQEGG